MHGKFNMAKLKHAEPPPPLRRRPAFIKQWRKFRKVTQARLAEALDMSEGNLSNIENGKQPYIQDHMEAIARILRCEVADLLRSPQDLEGIQALWARAKPDQRQQILKLVKALLSP